MADTLVLGTSPFGGGGSSPLLGILTKYKLSQSPLLPGSPAKRD